MAVRIGSRSGFKVRTVCAITEGQLRTLNLAREASAILAMSCLSRSIVETAVTRWFVLHSVAILCSVSGHYLSNLNGRTKNVLFLFSNASQADD